MLVLSPVAATLSLFELQNFPLIQGISWFDVIVKLRNELSKFKWPLQRSSLCLSYLFVLLTSPSTLLRPKTSPQSFYFSLPYPPTPLHTHTHTHMRGLTHIRPSVPSWTPSHSEARQGRAEGETFMRCRYLCRKAFLLLTLRNRLDADQAEPHALKQEAGGLVCRVRGNRIHIRHFKTWPSKKSDNFVALTSDISIMAQNYLVRSMMNLLPSM